MKKITFLLAIILSLVLVSCGGSKDKKVFTIAYAPNESTEHSANARSSLASDLSKEIGMEVKEIQASDYNAIIEALRTGKADMAYMGALAISLGNQRAGIEPIAIKAENGVKKNAIYHALLITSGENKNINTIKDIKGKTISFVDPGSTSGNLIPTAEIIKEFPEEDLNSEKLHMNGRFFSAVSYSGKHQAGLQAVIKGDIDVVPISDHILEAEIFNGRANKSDIKIIHKSGSIPAESMTVRKDLDEELKNKVKNFLVAYDNKEYFDKVIKQENARFVESSIDDYKAIIELDKILSNSK